MPLRGQGGGPLPVDAGDDVVGHQHAAGPGVDAGLEGQEVLLLEGLVGAAVGSDARMGVGVVAVAGEVLQDAAHLVLPVHVHHLVYITRGGGGVLAQGAVVHKGPGLPGDVAHRGEVHVQAQVPEHLALVALGVEHRLHAPGVVQVPGGPVGLVAQVGVVADPGDGAALLIGAHEHGYFGLGLAGGNLLLDLLPGEAHKVPAKKDVAAKLVLAHRLGGAVGEADEKQLAHLFLQRHGRKQLLRGGRSCLLSSRFCCGLGSRLAGNDNGDGGHAEPGLGGGVVGDGGGSPLGQGVAGDLRGVGDDDH